MTSTVSCADCESILIGDRTSEVGHSPCLICDSTRRIFYEHVQDVLSLSQQFGLKVKRPGIRRPIHEQVSGTEPTRSSGRLSDKVRVIDRLNDRYFERITDLETGQIIHERDEPLSHHFGRGTARFQEHGFPHDHIAVAAYYIWESKGRPNGHDIPHWNMAIEDVKRAAAGVPTLYS